VSKPFKPIAPNLLHWWDQHGRKDLPWQQQINPYRVWVSEIMLQQTQVTTVIEYYQRFIQRFPALSDLANAEHDEVMQHWAGLGYYSRARNLHKTAQICIEQHSGNLPDSHEQLMQLPGIGRSTAAAIMSLAFRQPHAILDGNVKRVLARYHAISGWPGESQVSKRLWVLAEQHTPEQRCHHYTQAIMDLGATVCLPRKPNCEVCPVATGCTAKKQEQVDQYPHKKKKPKIPTRYSYLILQIDQQGQVLIERRPPSGIWGGLWCLPVHKSDEPPEFAQSSGPLIKHTFTHFKLYMTPLLTSSQTSTIERIDEVNEQRWLNKTDMAKIGLPKPIKSLLQDYFEDRISWQELLTASN